MEITLLLITESSRGRVVKAMDQKSIGVSPRRFESCRLRHVSLLRHSQLRKNAVALDKLDCSPAWLFIFDVESLQEHRLRSLFQGFPGGAVVKNLLANTGVEQRHGFDPWVRKIPLEEEMATHSRILVWNIPRSGAWVAEKWDTLSTTPRHVSHS